MPRPRRAPFSIRSSCSFLLALVVGFATNSRADVVVSTLVGGPVGGDGGTFTVTTSGTISSAGDGIVASPANGITELYALGTVEAFTNGFVNDAGNLTILASVTGTLGGGMSGVVNSGSIGYFQVSTGIVRGADGPGLVTSGSIALLQVMPDGRISGAVTDGVRVEATGGIGTLQNHGLLGGMAGVASSGTIATITNEIGGSIAGTGYGILVSGGGVGSLANAGAITGPDGVITAGTIGTVTNAAGGAITGDVRGVRIEATGAVDSLDNAGTIAAAAGTAIQADAGATVGMFTNTGTVTSTEGVISAANLGLIVNQGLVAGTGNRGLGLISGTTRTVANTGTIAGAVTALGSSVSLDTISNDGEGALISGGWRGVQLDDPTKSVGMLANEGKIEGSDGIENRGLIHRVVNAGEILGTGEWGMSNGSASNVKYMLNEWVIEGAISGVGTSGTVEFLANNGTVRGTTGDAIAVASTGMMVVLTNGTSGTLVGGHRGVSNHGTLDRFTNDGVVTSPAESGLFSAPGSTLGIVTNSGTIQADFYGILASGISGTITNSDLVAATTYHGFVMNGSGAKLDLLANSGTISGGQRGVLVDVDATLSTFDNSGLVTGGDWGVFVADGARLFMLDNSGRITSAEGIGIVGTSGTITNSGKITAAAGRGILVDGGRVAEILSTGTISGNAATGAGVEITATGSVAAFTNRGFVGGDRAVVVTGSATVASLSNSGTLAGASAGISGSGGRVTALVNDQMGRIEGGAVAGIEGGDYDTIDNFGSIAGPLGVLSTGSVGTFTNRTTGDIVATGTAGIRNVGFRNTGTLATFVNEAGGLIESAGDGVSFGGLVTSASNAGTIVSTGTIGSVIVIDGVLGGLANSGTVAGPVGIEVFGAVSGTLANTATGVIEATRTGIVIDGAGTGAVVNAGRIAGGHHGVVDGTGGVALTNLSGGTITGTAFTGVVLQYGASMLVNEAGAIIESLGGSAVEVGYGLGMPAYVSGTLANAGVIRGDERGVVLRVVPLAPQSALRKLVNTGTLVATGAGGGPALEIESGASFGDPTGAGGPALTSTGPGASIGRIENSGTVHHGFRVENQDVVVTAGGSPGTFAGGTLEVPDGNLTFGAGTHTLGADVAVGGGGGVFAIEGTLRLLGIQSVTGAFEERTGGTVLIGLFGENPGDYGHLDITGSADFKGSLALDTSGLSGGLANGQSFQLFTFGASMGGFGALSVDGTSLTSLGVGLWSYGSFVLSENWTPTTMSLDVIRNSEKPTDAVPEIDPVGLAGVVSLVVGSLGVAERRLRRGRRSERTAG